WYFYDTVDGESKLRLVIDTIGREIVFDYDVNGNLTKISWDVTMGVKGQDDSRSQAAQTREINYTYLNAETFTEVSSLSAQVVDYETPYVLSTVSDPVGNITKYNYQPESALFTYDSAKAFAVNLFLLMTEVIDKYTAANGNFKNKRCFEYDYPAKGMHTKDFYNGTMEYFKISRQYIVNKLGSTKNDTTYVYYDKGENNNFNMYSAVVTRGDIKNTYAYTLSNNKYEDHVLDSLLTETTDGFLELKDYTYNTDRTKSREDVYRSGTWVYSEKFDYDTKGNLTEHTARGGLITNTTYDEKFSIPVKTTKKVTVNGIKQDYITENIINSLGQVTQQKIHTEAHDVIIAATMDYDIYGNVIAQTDAAGNTVHTVYDETFHCFPIKIYQDVDIASWNNGNDVHANWLVDPDGLSTMTIRSWKVFNTDGTVWIEIDNEGYAIEHYYDENGQEIETVHPDLNDERGFCSPPAEDFADF
ncbi:MAG: hypothetical protein MJB14_01720, partial [Spirochaetes bacterium]|nr:hypothetical protein [Spirochaetota bacterium]